MMTATRIAVEDGDTFVFSYPQRVTADQMKRLRSQIEKTFPSSKLIVLESGAHIEAVIKRNSESLT